MIRINPAISVLNTNEFFSTKDTKDASKSLILSSGGCCTGCTLDLPAIANLGSPSDSLTNDKVDFFLYVGKGTTVAATLIRLNPDGTETNYIITDDTYGNFFDTSVTKFLYWGFILDWYKVANTINFGRYKLNITIINIAGNEVYNEDSSCYHLMPYSCDNAHRTVKIQTEQSGYFEGGLDYTGLSFNLNGKIKNTWPQEVRFWGRFHRDGRTLVSDNIVTKDRGQEQIQTQTVKNFTLKVDHMMANYSDKIMDDMLQAPQILITDFNINNKTVEQEQRVVLTEFAETINFSLVKEEYFTIQFDEYYQNNVHRYK